MSLSLNDRNSLAEKVKSKIDTLIMEMFTDEQWTDLIKKEIEDLTAVKLTYNGEKTKSKLSVMIEKEVHTLIKSIISTQINKYISYDSLANDLLTKLVTEIISQPNFVEMFLANFVSQAVQGLKKNIENTLSQAVYSRS